MDPKTRNLVRLAVRRLVILSVVSVVIVLAISEAAFFFQKENTDRPPKVVELVIPEGAGAMVKAGKKVLSIPDEMVFVTGDTLVVRNNDTVGHTLGPLWIPASSSASLSMDKAENLAYACSFQNTSYLGLEVRPPTTLWTRMQGMLMAVPATVGFLYVYSLIVFPLEGKKKGSKSAGEPDEVSA